MKEKDIEKTVLPIAEQLMNELKKNHGINTKLGEGIAYASVVLVIAAIFEDHDLDVSPMELLNDCISPLAKVLVNLDPDKLREKGIWSDKDITPVEYLVQIQAVLFSRMIKILGPDEVNSIMGDHNFGVVH